MTDASPADHAAQPTESAETEIAATPAAKKTPAGTGKKKPVDTAAASPASETASGSTAGTAKKPAAAAKSGTAKSGTAKKSSASTATKKTAGAATTSPGATVQKSSDASAKTSASAKKASATETASETKAGAAKKPASATKPGATKKPASATKSSAASAKTSAAAKSASATKKPSAAKSDTAKTTSTASPTKTSEAAETPSGSTAPKKAAARAKTTTRARTATRTKATPSAADAPTSSLPDAERDRLDTAIAELGDGARAWTAMSIFQRIALLEAVRRSTASAMEDWALIAADSKGLHSAHPLRGEEWLSGPYSVLGALDAYIATLTRLATGKGALDGIRLGRAPGGRVAVDAFPLTGFDRVLLSGFRGQVWLRPGITPSVARREAGLGQRTPSAGGGIGLVLGAGNITSIPVLDVLYELLAHNRVVILKVNPTQDALVPVYEHALAPLIGPGLLRIVRGGPDAGAHLTAHPDIAHVHVTGSAATFDAIVWGADAAGARRTSESTPQLKTPITAELGGVSPIIVVPGEWSDADITFQAEHIATMRLQNSGHNCIAGQVVILSHDWPQRDQFRAALRRAYATAPERSIWYPNSEARMRQAANDYPEALVLADRLLVEIEGEEDATALQRTEYFAPVLGIVELPGAGQTFLDTAVAHANDELQGTLGANVLIDPDTEKELGAGFGRAIAALRYGSIAINTWTAVGFITPTLTWGAYPGNTIQDVGSGIGVVHNALLLDSVERSVVHGPFRPFPRSVAALAPSGRGRFTILPKPPWFVSARTAAVVSEGLTRYRASGGALGLVRTLLAALRA